MHVGRANAKSARLKEELQGRLAKVSEEARTEALKSQITNQFRNEAKDAHEKWFTMKKEMDAMCVMREH